MSFVSLQVGSLRIAVRVPRLPSALLRRTMAAALAVALVVPQSPVAFADSLSRPDPLPGSVRGPLASLQMGLTTDEETNDRKLDEAMALFPADEALLRRIWAQGADTADARLGATDAAAVATLLPALAQRGLLPAMRTADGRWATLLPRVADRGDARSVAVESPVLQAQLPRLPFWPTVLQAQPGLGGANVWTDGLKERLADATTERQEGITWWRFLAGNTPVRLGDDRIVYENVYGQDDLLARQTALGMQEVLLPDMALLSEQYGSSQAQHNDKVLEYIFELTNMTYRMEDDGSVVFLDEGGHEAYRLTAPQLLADEALPAQEGAVRWAEGFVTTKAREPKAIVVPATPEPSAEGEFFAPEAGASIDSPAAEQPAEQPETPAEPAAPVAEPAPDAPAAPTAGFTSLLERLQLLGTARAATDDEAAATETTAAIEATTTDASTDTTIIEEEAPTADAPAAEETATEDSAAEPTEELAAGADAPADTPAEPTTVTPEAPAAPEQTADEAAAQAARTVYELSPAEADFFAPENFGGNNETVSLLQEVAFSPAPTKILTRSNGGVVTYLKLSLVIDGDALHRHVVAAREWSDRKAAAEAAARAAAEAAAAQMPATEATEPTEASAADAPATAEPQQQARSRGLFATLSSFFTDAEVVPTDTPAEQPATEATDAPATTDTTIIEEEGTTAEATAAEPTADSEAEAPAATDGDATEQTDTAEAPATVLPADAELKTGALAIAWEMKLATVPAFTSQAVGEKMTLPGTLTLGWDRGVTTATLQGATWSDDARIGTACALDAGGGKAYIIGEVTPGATVLDVAIIEPLQTGLRHAAGDWEIVCSERGRGFDGMALTATPVRGSGAYTYPTGGAYGHVVQPLLQGDVPVPAAGERLVVQNIDIDDKTNGQELYYAISVDGGESYAVPADGSWTTVLRKSGTGYEAMNSSGIMASCGADVYACLSRTLALDAYQASAADIALANADAYAALAGNTTAAPDVRLAVVLRSYDSRYTPRFFTAGYTLAAMPVATQGDATEPADTTEAVEAADDATDAPADTTTAEQPTQGGTGADATTPATGGDSATAPTDDAATTEPADTTEAGEAADDATDAPADTTIDQPTTEQPTTPVVEAEQPLPVAPLAPEVAEQLPQPVPQPFVARTASQLAQLFGISTATATRTKVLGDTVALFASNETARQGTLLDTLGGLVGRGSIPTELRAVMADMASIYRQRVELGRTWQAGMRLAVATDTGMATALLRPTAGTASLQGTTGETNPVLSYTGEQMAAYLYLDPNTGLLEQLLELPAMPAGGLRWDTDATLLPGNEGSMQLLQGDALVATLSAPVLRIGTTTVTGQWQNDAGQLALLTPTLPAGAVALRLRAQLAAPTLVAASTTGSHAFSRLLAGALPGDAAADIAATPAAADVQTDNGTMDIATEDAAGSLQSAFRAGAAGGIEQNISITNTTGAYNITVKSQAGKAFAAGAYTSSTGDTALLASTTDVHAYTQYALGGSAAQKEWIFAAAPQTIADDTGTSTYRYSFATNDAAVQLRLRSAAEGTVQLVATRTVQGAAGIAPDTLAAIEANIGSMSSEEVLMDISGFYYYTADGSKKDVRPTITDSGDLLLSITEPVASYPLVVDPLRTFAMTTGGSGYDVAQAVATDAAGNIYVAGATGSTGSTLGGCSMLGTQGGSNDGFVMKFDPQGQCLWGRYVGGANTEELKEIVVAHQSVYAAGYTLAMSATMQGNTINTTLAGTTSGRSGLLVRLGTDGSWMDGAYVNNGNGTAITDLHSVAATSTGIVVLGRAESTGTTYGTGNTMSGATTAGTGSADVTLIALSPTFGWQWGRFIGDTGAEIAYRVTTDSLDNVYVGGYTTSTAGTWQGNTMDRTQAGGSNDAFITKFSSSGTFAWGRVFGSSGNDYLYGLALQGGTLYTAQTNAATMPGTTYGTYQSNTDGSVSAFDTGTGSHKWTRQWGGSGVETLRGLAATTTGVAALGHTTSTSWPTVPQMTDSFTGTQDAFVLYVNTTGDITAAHLLGQASVTSSLMSAATTVGGRLVAAGYTDATANTMQGQNVRIVGSGGTNILLAVYDPSQPASFGGRYIGSSGSDFPRAPITDTAGNVYIAGAVSAGLADGITTDAAQGGNDLLVQKYSADGMLLWSRILGGSGSDAGGSMAYDATRNIILIGGNTGSAFWSDGTTFLNTYGGGSTDYFAMAIDAATGAVRWARYIGGAGDEATALSRAAVDASGNSYFVLSTSSTDTAFNGTDSVTGTSGGSADALVASLAADGSFRWARYIGGTGTDTANAMVLGDDSMLYITGSTTSTDANWQSNAMAGTSGGAGQPFVAKLNTSGAWQTGRYINDAGQGTAIWTDSASGGLLYVTGAYGASNPQVAIWSLSRSDFSGTTRATLPETASTNTPRSLFRHSSGALALSGLTTASSFTGVSGTNAGGSDCFFLLYQPAAQVFSGQLVGTADNEGQCTSTENVQGRVHLSGSTTSTATTWGGYTMRNTNAGSSDIFLLELQPRSTTTGGSYVGGTSADAYTRAIAASDGGAYLVGSTDSNETTLQGVAVNNQVTAGASTRNMLITRVSAAGTVMWHAKYGGNVTDETYANPVEYNGSLYVAGNTTSTNLPGLVGTPQGGSDVLLLKINATTGTVDNAVLMGGSGADTPYGFALDSSGGSLYAYVTGTTTSTSALWAVGAGTGAITGTQGGGIDTFALKADITTITTPSLAWARYIGGSGSEVNEAGLYLTDASVYLSGWTDSTEAAFQSTTLGGTAASSRDIMLASLNSSTGAVRWIIRSGDTGQDHPMGIAVSGNTVAVAGHTASTAASWGSANAMRSSHQGGTWDSFIQVFDAATGAYRDGRYLGTTGDDIAHTLSVDADNNYVVSGYTGAAPTAWTASMNGRTMASAGTIGGNDIFAIGLTRSLDVAWGTQLGGSGADYPRATVALDGKLLLAGSTTSTTTPWYTGTAMGTASTNGDAFYTLLDTPTASSANVPAVTAVTASPTSGSYGTTAAVAIDVSFSSTVAVVGSPTLRLETGTVDRTAAYASGSGTSTLRFVYTVQAGDAAARLNYTATDALQGSITAATGGAPANTALPDLSSTKSLAGTSNIVIDTTAPTLTLQSLSGGKTRHTASWGAGVTAADNSSNPTVEYCVSTSTVCESGTLTSWTSATTVSAFGNAPQADAMQTPALQAATDGTIATSSTGQYVATTGTGALYYSTDYGATWTAKRYGEQLGGDPLAAATALGMSADGQTLLIAVGNAVYRSTNAGTTWAVTSITTVPVAKIVMNASGVALAISNTTQTATNARLLRSTDSGANWAAVGPTLASGHAWRDVSISGTVAVAASGDGTANGALHRSTDSGANWTTNIGSFPTNAAYTLAAVANTGTHIAAYTATQIGYQSTNSGTTVLSISPSLTYHSLAYARAADGGWSPVESYANATHHRIRLLRLTANNVGDILLYPASIQALPATAYRLAASSDGSYIYANNGSRLAAMHAATANTPKYIGGTLSGISANQTYYIHARAVDAAGNKSAIASSSVQVLPAQMSATFRSTNITSTATSGFRKVDLTANNGAVSALVAAAATGATHTVSFETLTTANGTVASGFCYVPGVAGSYAAWSGSSIPAYAFAHSAALQSAVAGGSATPTCRVLDADGQLATGSATIALRHSATAPLADAPITGFSGTVSGGRQLNITWAPARVRSDVLVHGCSATAIAPVYSGTAGSRTATVTLAGCGGSSGLSLQADATSAYIDGTSISAGSTLRLQQLLGSTPVALAYSTNSGSSWTNISTATENDGSYLWTVPDATGTLRLRMTVTDALGNTASYDTADINTVSSSTMQDLELVSGNSQGGGMDEVLGQELRVRVGNGYGSYAGAGTTTVTFTIASSPADSTGQQLQAGTSGQGHSAAGSTMTVQTDANGYAGVRLRLGDRAGDYTVTANYAGNTSGVKTFTATERQIFDISVTASGLDALLNPAASGANSAAKTVNVSIVTNARGYTLEAVPAALPTRSGGATLPAWTGLLGWGWKNNGSQPTTTAFSGGSTPSATTVYSCAAGPSCQGTANITLDLTAAVNYLTLPGSYSTNVTLRKGTVTW